MASKEKYDSSYCEPRTYPNKPGASSGKASAAGKHERSMAHVQPGMALAAQLAKKNRGGK